MATETDAGNRVTASTYDLADKYSTPAHVVFEDDVKKEVNRRLGRLAITSVCRLDSRAADPLQVVDFLTAP